MRARRKTFRRGRTRPDRLRLLDRLLHDRKLVLQPMSDPMVVDVGFGDEPTTTEALHGVMLSLFQGVKTVGVEADEGRAEKAQDCSTESLRFVHGGFNLTTLGLKNVSLIRCFNVLRGYGLWDVKPALLQMAKALGIGGLLVEGTTDVEGALIACHLWRRSDERRLNYEGLLCGTDFRRGFSPLMFRDVLPRDLRRHNHPGEPAFDFLARWEREASALRSERPKEKSRAQGDNRAIFLESLVRLSRKDPLADASLREGGFARFVPERPSTRPEVLSPDDPI